MWQNYTDAVLGLLVLILAFAGLAGSAQAWTFGILGAVILVLGLWGGAMDSSSMMKRNM
jgi:hypothetical protein